MEDCTFSASACNHKVVVMTGITTIRECGHGVTTIFRPTTFLSQFK